MKVAVIGVGAMGNAMLGHIVRKGIGQVSAYDVDGERLAAATKLGARGTSSAVAAAAEADLAILMVVNDRQVDEIVDDLAKSVRNPLLVAVAATIHPDTMVAAGSRLASTPIRLIDAPVVYGLQGAIEGNMVSLCGGAADDVAAARPALLAYSRAVHHIGPLGAGMVAKTANNMLHWANSCAGFEALLLVKRYGLDAQRMRQILLDCPARSGTLERWDTTHFTWPEKDMDIALEMAQSLGLSLPLFGIVDQLIKHLSADAVGFTQCTHLSCPGDWPKRTETRMDIGLFDRPCCTDRSEFHASLNPLFRLGFLRCVHTTAPPTASATSSMAPA